jgi:nitrate reductase gamma subunit
VQYRPDESTWVWFNNESVVLTELCIYIGGILGTIILIALIIWFVRRV